ncbi:MAG: GTPase Era [Spirochaetes bacterium GWD1_61_31]|nr:MAG: GTPase Era [Spirochaetes bacterium GWB1_60_80]OHD34557.1 MAG: GTPase Era [Spirochaetes bacterium GWC1_61_12]OHD41423.1 MAG: GTPase Era [Spirochaetes bacterium GWD1_61_31]OHD45206.1 MAG: GTPase Era [Spirochaetes bacterium GWE1_60_18]OHD60706.1 MAG: GTPase Era [Spirochaetes bacterium GWF1_60_12]HAP43906.1 GTPase Era [Spirochaetaceae bacterium]
MDTPHKSAFISVVGRPSAGKSTLLNQICGEKVAIVSPVPQTTRNTIRGIRSRPDCQLVFIDTPGLHDSEKAINRKLRDLATRNLAEADMILYVVDSTRAPGKEEETIASLVAPYVAKCFGAVNKIDSRESDTTAARLFLSQKVSGLRVFDISAQTGSGVEALLAAIEAAAPEGPAYYPEEFYTDQEPVFRIAEIIREKVFLHTRNEVPHAIYVDYRSHHMLADGTLVYEGDLVVERDTQKGIIIGKGGAMIKQIREEAERDLAEIFPYAVQISLKVKVDPHWKKNDNLLKRLIQ